MPPVWFQCVSTASCQSRDYCPQQVLSAFSAAIVKPDLVSAEAIELYERSLGIDANDDLVHNAIASLYRKQGAYARSEEHYQKALAIDNSYARTYYNYANLLAEMDEKARAESMYRKALELDRDFDEAREALAELEEIVATLEEGQGQLEEAIRLFERGQALAARCGVLLEAAELKVKQVVGDELTDFEEESA